MTLREPFPIENIGAVYNARDYRALFKRLFDDRPGIFNAADLVVTQQAVPAMGITVAAGGGLVDATGAGIDGLYFVDNDAPVNVALAAADAVNPRRDIIGIRVRDSESAGANNDGTILAVTGVPAAVPVDPALPSNFLVLARVAVAALAGNIVNANITDLRRTTVGQGGLVTAAGGIIVCTSTTRPTVNLEDGIRIFETDTQEELVYVNGGWLVIGPNFARETTVTASSGGGTTSSTTYVDTPGGGTSIANFNKRRTGTKLVITVHGGVSIDDALTSCFIGIDIGGTDTDIARADTFIGNGPLGFSGTITITGITAGVIALIKVQWKVSAGTVVATHTGRWSLSVRETF